MSCWTRAGQLFQPYLKSWDSKTSEIGGKGQTLADRLVLKKYCEPKGELGREFNITPLISWHFG